MVIVRRFVPTLQEAQSLQSVARLLSFSAAARELNLTQPTISYHISKLEGKWGAKLFRVKGKNLEPTEFMQSILPEIRTITHQLEHIGHLVGSQYHQKVLSIGITPSLATIVLQRRISKFLDEFPGTNVRICASNRYSNLKEDRIDIAIRMLPRNSAASSKDKPNILVPVPAERMRVVCSPEYFARITEGLPQHTKLNVTFFSQAQLIYEDEALYWANYFSTFWGDFRPSTRPSLTYNNADLILQAAIDGSGLAILRDIFVMDAIREGRLIEPFPMRLECERVFQFIVPETAGVNQPAYNFMTWFGNELTQLALESVPHQGSTDR